MNVKMLFQWKCEKCNCDNEFTITRQHVGSFGTFSQRCNDCQRHIEINVEARQKEMPYAVR